MTAMATGRSEELFRALQSKGYPDDYTATRMLGYLYRISKPRIEDVVDEMLAILSDRDRLVEKHQVEDAQAKLNEVYHYGLGTEDE